MLNGNKISIIIINVNQQQDTVPNSKMTKKRSMLIFVKKAFQALVKLFSSLIFIDIIPFIIMLISIL